MQRVRGLGFREHKSWGRFAPLRGLARSHRFCVCLKACECPVGAGKPAKGRKAAPAIEKPA
ncbi:hypothetical protein EGJ22_13175 [Pseudomonas sp. p99-361]|nr:hypothetical protein HV87_15155 [Pseudomonas aeruginosa]QEQ87354.1 hypothetical protein F1602_08460 [Pseudomonas putida]RRV18619.1 hypothetical protein EGJ22_13175 [Pseudomonas sp. p99-361]